MVKVTGMHEVLDALAAVIKTAPKAERDALALVMEDCAKDFPHDYYEYLWKVGAQSPKLLYHLIYTIKAAAADDGQKRGRITLAVQGLGHAGTHSTIARTCRAYLSGESRHAAYRGQAVDLSVWFAWPEALLQGRRPLSDHLQARLCLFAR